MQTIEAVIYGWYAAVLADVMNRAPAKCAEQMRVALEALLDALASADPEHPREDAILPWFEAHFHAPPIAHDTALYNAVHASLDELRARLST